MILSDFFWEWSSKFWYEDEKTKNVLVFFYTGGDFADKERISIGTRVWDFDIWKRLLIGRGLSTKRRI